MHESSRACPEVRSLGDGIRCGVPTHAVNEPLVSTNEAARALPESAGVKGAARVLSFISFESSSSSRLSRAHDHRGRRESDVVRLLALHRFLTRPQLEAFLFAESNLTSRSRQVVTWRLLGRLQRRDVPEKNTVLNKSRAMNDPKETQRATM